MTLKNFSSGVNTNFSTQLNGNNNALWKTTLNNHTRQLIDRAGVYSADGNDIWGEAYVDADGRNDSVVVAETTAVFDTNKYKCFNQSTFVIIEATSLNEVNFSINDCVCKKIDTGKWVLYCTTGTEEVKRAKIYATLFYNKKVLNIVGLSKLKTSVTRDVGSMAYYASCNITNVTTSGERTAIVSGNFSNTTSNYVSGWSSCSATASGYSGSHSYFEIPEATVLNTAASNGVENSNEINTDRVADEKTNPANIRFRTVTNRSNGTHNCSINAFILTKYSVSLSLALSGANTSGTITNFYEDESVPKLELGSISEISTLITHIIPSGTFPANISSAIGTPLVADWEDGASVKYKLTNQYWSVFGNQSEVTTTSESFGSATKSITPFRQLTHKAQTVKAEVAANQNPGGEIRIRFTYSDLTTQDIDTEFISLSPGGSTYQWIEINNPQTSKTATLIEFFLRRKTGGSGTVYFRGNSVIEEANTINDSGWLNSNVISTFTAFTNEPTSLIVKLIPKSVSPSSGIPSVRGFSLRAE